MKSIFRTIFSECVSFAHTSLDENDQFEVRWRYLVIVIAREMKKNVETFAIWKENVCFACLILSRTQFQRHHNPANSSKSCTLCLCQR